MRFESRSTSPCSRTDVTAMRDDDITHSLARSVSRITERIPEAARFVPVTASRSVLPEFAPGA
jgi:hypothetical protein